MIYTNTMWWWQILSYKTCE